MSAITASPISPSSTLVAQAVSAPAGADAAIRAALERAYRLPSYTPPPNPAGLAGNLARAAGIAGAFLAGRYLTSEGELNLLKDTRQIPGYITSNDMRSASSAFTGAGFDGTRAQNLSADQKGRLIAGSAELQRLFESGNISQSDRDRGLTELFNGLVQGRTSPQPVERPQYGPSLEELQRGSQQQRQNNNSAQYPPTPPVREVVPAMPNAPSRIGGVTADRVPYSDANLQQAINDARTYNAASNTQTALGYAVRDSGDGNWYVERMMGITPSNARTLVYNLNQRQQLAHPSEDVFRSNGIGGWADSNGKVAGAEKDLQIREANAYFASLTPRQFAAAAQNGALTVNGKQGTVYSVESAGALRSQIVGTQRNPGANAVERGEVSLAIQRNYQIPGPNGMAVTLRGVELFPNLSPAEARSVLNAAAQNGSLYAPPGTGDAIDWNLAQNGLSRDGLVQREQRLANPPRQSDPNTPNTPDEPDKPKPQLEPIPESTPLPGGNDVARVAKEYGVAEGDIIAMIQANPGMSAEQAAQRIKGELLNGPTGTNQAQVNTPPPPNGGDGTTTATGTPSEGEGRRQAREGTLPGWGRKPPPERGPFPKGPYPHETPRISDEQVAAAREALMQGRSIEPLSANGEGTFLLPFKADGRDYIFTAAGIEHYDAGAGRTGVRFINPSTWPVDANGRPVGVGSNSQEVVTPGIKEVRARQEALFEYLRNQGWDEVQFTGIQRVPQPGRDYDGGSRSDRTYDLNY
jgi:hypothetical protein